MNSLQKTIVISCIFCGLFLVSFTHAAATELTFTFNPPDSSDTSVRTLTQDEITQIQAVLPQLYSIAKSVYGQPYVSTPINIVKSLSSTGGYSYNTHQLSIPDMNQVSFLAHELLHAFHDSTTNALEEGFVTAATEKVLTNYNPNYTVDMRGNKFWYTWYDYYNQPFIIYPSNCDIGFNGFARYYSLPGVAFEKMTTVTPNFFAQVNEHFYQKIAANSQLNKDQAFKDTITEVVPTIENEPLSNWWKKQIGLVDKDVYFDQFDSIFVLYRRPAFEVHLRSRYPTGCSEQQITAQFYDVNGTLLGSHSVPLYVNDYTGSHFQLPNLTFLQNYTGRLLVKLRASPLEATTKATIFHDPEKYYFDDGLKGIVLPQTAGSVKVTADQQIYDKPVVNGQFAVPELASFSGQLKVELFDENQQLTATRAVIKPYLREYAIIINTNSLDLDNDAKVDGDDLTQVLEFYPRRKVTVYDLNGDEKTNSFDALKILAGFTH